MSTNDNKTPIAQTGTLDELNKLIWNHLKARDWHHQPTRGLAISLNLEAAELLEHYQWGDEPAGGVSAVAEELADVFIYTLQVAQQNDIDIAAEVRKKIEKSAKKYPANDFKGKTVEDRSEVWIKRKLAHQKEGL